MRERMMERRKREKEGQRRGPRERWVEDEQSIEIGK